MKQFRNKVIAKLFYEILGYLICNGLFPKKIEFWVEEETMEVVCNLFYCPNKEVKGQGPAINNIDSQTHKRMTNQYPTLREDEMTNELNDDKPFGYPDVRKSDDELTDCERSYAKHLKTIQKEIES